ncbi:MAG: oxygen-independent coproporphyrinogen III oxidase [Gammaproteobacteria bacterium]|nr:oxygen-independent coproporphyrinogen III oxidase [Gammaproteobacteria bacterium]
MQIDTQLIEKYNISGPRYTSYPTALEFHQEFTTNSYLSALSSIEKQKLSIYIHIPFCRNICYYCACNKVITKDSQKADEYIQYLLKEAQLVAKHCASKDIGQIHFGGGTPTFLTSEQIQLILEKLTELFDIDDDAEISIEIDPRTVDRAKLGEFKKIGFNRLSIGVQDFDRKVQSAVNREHSFEMVDSLFVAARSHQFDSVNMDLIYGLPHQTTETFAKTIEQVLKLAPNRIALYNYAHLPHRFKPQRRINADDLPSAEQKIAIFEQTMNQLIEAGYVYIGMDHFALPDDSLNIAQQNGKLHRNFQGYTTHKNYQLVGLGVSSISKVANCYSQNKTDLPSYYQSLAEDKLPVWRGCILSQDDELRRDVIMSLICNFKLDIKAIESAYDISFAAYFKDELEQLNSFIDDGLVILSKEQILITESGRFFIRNICMQFDRYLQEINQLQAFSKVI